MRIFESTAGKIILALYMVGLPLFVILFIAVVSDEKPDPEAIEFLFEHNNTIADKNNAWYAVIGITAPEFVQDTHAYGIRNIQPGLNHKPDYFSNTEPPWYKLDVADNEIEFIGDSSILECWVRFSKPEFSSCISVAAVEKMIADNAILLDRYVELFQYTGWQATALFGRNFEVTIALNRLLLAKVHVLMKSGQTYKAQKLWADNTRFWRRMISQPVTLVDKIVMLSNYNLSVAMLPRIVERGLYDDIDLQKIMAAIPLMGVSEWQIDDMLRQEYSIIESITCAGESLGYKGVYHCAFADSIRKSYYFKPHTTINYYYAYVNKFKEILRKHPMEVKDVCEAAVKEWSGEKISLFQDFNVFQYDELLLRSILGSNMVGCRLIERIYLQITEIRLLNLFLQIKVKNMAINDVGQYISNSTLVNPFTKTSFNWNKRNKMIAFSFDSLEGRTQFEWKLYDF